MIIGKITKKIFFFFHHLIFCNSPAYGLLYLNEVIVADFNSFLAQKCQKIGHFSSKKAFFAFFLAMVLARTINFAEEKRRNRQWDVIEPMTRNYQACDKKLSHRWQNFVKPMIIFCQAFEKTWQKGWRVNLDKEKLKFGRLQTVVWAKENSSLDITKQWNSTVVILSEVKKRVRRP